MSCVGKKNIDSKQFQRHVLGQRHEKMFYHIKEYFSNKIHLHDCRMDGRNTCDFTSF